jgi:hypothetical protein
MPYSYDYFKIEVGNHIIKSFPPSTKILDVGAGSGKYGSMLRYNFYIDALEIFEPYIEQFQLKEIYNNVHIGNIIDFDISIYDYIIMGDIVEHLSVEDAHDLLTKIHLANKKCLVAIPYTMEQGEVNGNIYETHLQSDLTHDVFLFRYPMMKELYRNNEYGYYINYQL